MKHTPIIVRVPGAGVSDDLWLTPSEARVLVVRLERELKVWDTCLRSSGVKHARKVMSRRYHRSRP